ncbi:hypothetical protein ACFQ3S_14110 [Mucilaginibacter terrae]|uniref:hypothetical protein n=1 Tax=Mucilaginibacter terrae TaxID=1955052 RepID=UPI00362DFE96
MILFEEFFKKKKINLAALQQDDQELFSEFKDHYEQMGEKSFDHTKKYWFNKLRRQYPLPPEVKAERLRPENQIAEQTVADTLTEPSITDNAPDMHQAQLAAAENKPAEPAPKMGFKPKFKAASPVQAYAPEEATPQQTPENNEATPAETPAAPKPKPGFKPRFKTGVTNSQPIENTTETPLINNAQPEASTNKPDNPINQTTTPPKTDLEPHFKAGVTNIKITPEIEKPVAPETVKAEVVTPTVEPQAEPTTEPDGPPAPKPAYKPRFTPNMIKRKPPEGE